LKPEINRSWVIWLTRLLYFSILISPFLPPVIWLLVVIAALFTYKGKWVIRGWPEGVFFGFLFLSLVSWYFNPVWYKLTPIPIPVGIVPILLFGGYYLLTVWFKRVVNWSWRDVQNMYLQFWLGGLYVVVIAFIQQLDMTQFEHSWLKDLLHFYKEYQWQSDNPNRSVGTAGNSNLAAAMLICFALMSIYAFFILPKRWQKIASLVTFVLFGYAIWSTGSRGALGGLAIGLMVQIWMAGYRKFTLGSFTLAIFLVLSFPQMIPRSESIMYTFQHRLKVWSTAWEIFKENWLFGTLPLHFAEIYQSKTGDFVYHAHNVILGFASEYGIIGLTLFIILIFMTIKRARMWKKMARSKEEKRLVGMLFSQTVAILGHGMYDYPIMNPQIGLIFMLSIIMIHSQYERSYVSEWATSGRKKWFQSKFMEVKTISAIVLVMKNLFVKKEG
jgi:putative inorganic carbon (hco3(-)) transporter